MLHIFDFLNARNKSEFWNATRCSLLIALIHSLIFDLTCYYVYSGNNLLFALKAAIACVGISWPLFYFISWARTYGRWIYVCIFAIDSLATYFVWNYKLEISADTLALMYESNLQEASAFVGLPLILWLLGCVSCIFIVTHFERPNNFSSSNRYATLIILLAVSIFSYGALKHIGHKTPKPLPANILQESQRYIKERSHLKKMLAQKFDISKSFIKTPQDKPIIVLVIGESARADHFSLNGYKRNTNPNLEKIGVTSYKTVVSCGNKTRISVPCLLTRNTVENHKNLLKETSLISIFRAAGFSTAWYSNQRVMHENDTVTTSIANEAESVYFTKLSYNNARDEFLLPRIKEFVSSENKAKMLVVHTIGSHWAYNHRYDGEHEKFEPVCSNSTQRACSENELINAYDNSILYTDWFIAKIIDGLENKNAMLIYVSDHGESLGEDGLFCHGQKEFRKEQRMVPLIIWASEQYKALHADRLAAAQEKINEPLSHDVIFHSTLGCAGIETSMISNKLNLCAREIEAK